MAEENNATQAKPINPVTVGIVGGIAGAALGVGIAMALSDATRRKTVIKKIEDFKKWGEKAMNDLRKLESFPQSTKKDVEEVSEKAKDKRDTLEEKLDKQEEEEEAKSERHLSN